MSDPFIISQYKTSFSKAFEFTPDVLAFSDLPRIISIIANGISARQEAVKIGYNLDPTEPLINVTIFDVTTPDGIKDVLELFQNAVKQFVGAEDLDANEFSLLDRYAKYTTNTGEKIPYGFFFRANGNYYSSLSEILEPKTEFSAIPATEDYLRLVDYVDAVTPMVNELINALNRLRYFHGMMIFTYDDNQLCEPNTGSGDCQFVGIKCQDPRANNFCGCWPCQYDNTNCAGTLCLDTTATNFGSCAECFYDNTSCDDDDDGGGGDPCGGYPCGPPPGCNPFGPYCRQVGDPNYNKCKPCECRQQNRCTAIGDPNYGLCKDCRCEINQDFCREEGDPNYNTCQRCRCRPGQVACLQRSDRNYGRCIPCACKSTGGPWCDKPGDVNYGKCLRCMGDGGGGPDIEPGDCEGPDCVPCEGPDCPCEGPDCPCEGPDCPCEGPDCPCEGPGCGGGECPETCCHPWAKNRGECGDCDFSETALSDCEFPPTEFCFSCDGEQLCCCDPRATNYGKSADYGACDCWEGRQIRDPNDCSIGPDTGREGEEPVAECPAYSYDDYAIAYWCAYDFIYGNGITFRCGEVIPDSDSSRNFHNLRYGCHYEFCCCKYRNGCTESEQNRECRRNPSYLCILDRNGDIMECCTDFITGDPNTVPPIENQSVFNQVDSSLGNSFISFSIIDDI